MDSPSIDPLERQSVHYRKTLPAMPARRTRCALRIHDFHYLLHPLLAHIADEVDCLPLGGDLQHSRFWRHDLQVDLVERTESWLTLLWYPPVQEWTS